MERAYRGAGSVGGKPADARPEDRPPAAPRVILGCGNFGGIGSAPAFFGQGETLEQALALMDAAWEAGITWFDTADAYGGGRSETYIGEWVRSRRPDGLRITTKTFNPMDEGEDRGLAPERVRRQIDTSLRRLGVERVDLYLSHAWDDDVPAAELAGVFDELVAAGKIGAYGLSNVDGARLREALAAGSFSAVQDSYSLLDREVEEEVLPLCAEHGLWFQVHSPLMGGWLTGKYRRDAPAPDGSRMTLRSAPYEHLRTDAVYDAIEALERRGDPATLALAWLLADERVSVVLGPRRPEHLRPGLAALEHPLSPAEREAIADEFRLAVES
ncbi:MAG TPA: aldo/keto reductase [Gaiellaceae bacterium]|nr:aldo/keto reductase [Gaiellaceae bacterium]